MSELERVTGVPRGTIYYYIRKGVIPPSLERGHRTGLYTEEHVKLLTTIRRLRKHRVSLNEIGDHIRRADDETDDETGLATRREAEIRKRILSTAARIFTEKGFRKTGVDEIIAELEMAPGTLYRFFPTKRDLFVQSIRYLVGASSRQIESRVMQEKVLPNRMLRRVNELLKIGTAPGEILLAARAAALGEDDELDRLVRQTYAEWLQPMIDDLRVIADETSGSSVLDPELVGYAVVGAADAVLMRASWDGCYSESDVGEVLTFLCRAMLAALTNSSEAGWAQSGPAGARSAPAIAQAGPAARQTPPSHLVGLTCPTKMRHSTHAENQCSKDEVS
jgi:AcrR family transcriptional regulator